MKDAAERDILLPENCIIFRISGRAKVFNINLIWFASQALNTFVNIAGYWRLRSFFKIRGIRWRLYSKTVGAADAFRFLLALCFVFSLEYDAHSGASEGWALPLLREDSVKTVRAWTITAFSGLQEIQTLLLKEVTKKKHRKLYIFVLFRILFGFSLFSIDEEEIVNSIVLFDLFFVLLDPFPFPSISPLLSVSFFFIIQPF